jgi:hypothetical protein
MHGGPPLVYIAAVNSTLGRGAYLLGVMHYYDVSQAEI